MEVFERFSKSQVRDIKNAIKNKTPIIIKGEQGKSGKTYTANELRKLGGIVYEEWECLILTI